MGDASDRNPRDLEKASLDDVHETRRTFASGGLRSSGKPRSDNFPGDPNPVRTVGRRFKAPALAVLLGVLLAAPAPAQNANVTEVALAGLSTERKAIVADRMQLGEQEAENFWPIYNEYLDARMDLTRKLRELVETLGREFETLDDETADELLKDYHAFREDRLELRWKTAKKLRKELGPKRAGRFYQLENKLDTLTDMDLVKAVPLVE